MKSIKRKLKLLVRMFFGRGTVVIVSVLAQLAFFFIVSHWMYKYSVFIYWLFILLGACVVIHILNEDVNSSFKLVWMIPVLVIPVFGTLLYLYVNLQMGTRMMRKRLRNIDVKVMDWFEDYSREERLNTVNQIKEKDVGEYNFARYMIKTGGFCPYKENDVKFFSLGEYKYDEMLVQLKNAKKFIFMEYFIVSEGLMWNSILDVLKQKAAQGVEVRFMYDGTCSLFQLPFFYYKELEKYGIKSRPFSQVKPVFTTVQNNRDHRKILVIDGKVAFTGGVNIADEYINKLDRFGHWKDTAVMVKGDSVSTFTYMFLKMWNVADKKDYILPEELEKYIFRVKNISDAKEEGHVIPYGSGPFSSERTGRQVYIDILNRAEKYVHIMTPYLVLDDEMVSSLIYCAKRGVETVIIMPHIPDKKYAYDLARAHYEKLVANGVKIYEYTPGFVHAKEFICDDKRAVVGSVNMDFRSFYLHFECGLYMYGVDAIEDIEDDFIKTLEKSVEITEKDCRDYPWYRKLGGEFLALIAPLM